MRARRSVYSVQARAPGQGIQGVKLGVGFAPRLCSDVLSARVSLVLSNTARSSTFYKVRNLVLQKDRLMSETEVLPPDCPARCGKTVGVLALQGGVAEHARMLESLEAQGGASVEKVPSKLAGNLGCAGSARWRIFHNSTG